MACNCRSGAVNRKKRPDEPCIYCAHKHIATAKQLCCELGYTDINKSDAIGQLILAAWHYDREHHDLALRCRDIWLALEQLQDVRETLAELQGVAWNLVVSDVTKTGRSA